MKKGSQKNENILIFLARSKELGRVVDQQPV
jgi:hypothetical protein